ncbi:MAG: PorT family protein [Bacteroidia bacterium]|nr:PorT family protein [Bacteroidia bacterium]
MTNKIIFGFIVLMAAVTVTHAQTIIPHAGLVVSTNNADPSEEGFDYDISPKTGFTFGASYKYALGTLGKGIFSIQAGASFIQKGVKAKSTQILAQEGDWVWSLNTNEKFTINYLEVPVQARYEMGPTNFRYYVMAGPSVAYGLGGKYKATVNYSDGYFPEMTVNGKVKFGDEPEENEEDAYFDNRIDFGMQFGAGITLFQRVNVDVRYGLGLTDLMDDETSKNRVLQFTVGVPLTFK